MACWSAGASFLGSGFHTIHGRVLQIWRMFGVKGSWIYQGSFNYRFLVIKWDPILGKIQLLDAKMLLVNLLDRKKNIQWQIIRLLVNIQWHLKLSLALTFHQKNLGWGSQTWCNSMVNLTDFPLHGSGWNIMTPVYQPPRIPVTNAG